MLKIETSSDSRRRLTVTLAGILDADHLEELEALVQRAVRDGRLLSLDLSQVRMVDRQAVAFLASGAGRHVHLAGCPTWLRKWLDAEDRHHL